MVTHAEAWGYTETGDGWKKSEQGRLFNPARYSPVTLLAWLRLPSSSARDFAVATCLGKSLRSDGTFLPLRHAKDLIAVVIQPGQRKAIIRVADITPDYWKKLVVRWQETGLAHRCNRLTVCLFISPDEPQCPYCQGEKGTISTPLRGQSVQTKGTISAGFEHESGDTTRDEQGDVAKSPVVGGRATSPKPTHGRQSKPSHSPAEPELEYPCIHRTSLDKERVCGSCRRRRSGQIAQMVNRIGIPALEEERHA